MKHIYSSFSLWCADKPPVYHTIALSSGMENIAKRS